MGIGFLHGQKGGGASMNFRVIGGTTAPASPKANDIWVNTDTEITSWDFSTTEPCRRSANRNLLTYPYYHTTMTDNGITFTDNGDGTVKANGTATAQARFRPFHTNVASGMIWLDPGTYTASGCPKGGSRTTYFWEVYDADALKGLAYDIGDGATFTLTHGTHVRGSFVINSGNELTNAVFKPQIEKGSSPTSFVKGDATGQVWIATGASSPVAFDAVKKNGLMVYPLKASQYIGGAWVEKTAKSYQGGAWVDWTVYLFNDGDQCTGLTGGWAEFSKPSNTTVTIGNILAVKSDKSGNTARLSTVGAVDLSGAKTLWITSPGASSGRYAGTVHLCTSKDTGSSVASVTLGDSSAYKSGKYSIDVSGLNGSYYIFMTATASQYGAGYADASEIWIE